MFLTKFSRKDGKPDEEYFYHTQEEALQHLDLFLEDDSCLYRSIVASDEKKNTVIQVLLFDEEGRATSYKEGDLVCFHPDYCSEGERKYIFVITNLNDRMMRAEITCVNSSMAIPPAETVELKMIRQTGLTVADVLDAK